MRWYNPTLITNIGLVTFFGMLFVEKLFNPPNVEIINVIYAIGAVMILFGTIGYFMRKQ